MDSIDISKIQLKTLFYNQTFQPARLHLIILCFINYAVIYVFLSFCEALFDFCPLNPVLDKWKKMDGWLDASSTYNFKQVLLGMK